MKKIKFLVLIPALAILAACSKPEVKQGVLKYEMKSYSQAVGDTSGLSNNYATAVLKYPEIKEATSQYIMDNLNNFVRANVLTALFKEGEYKTPEFFMENFLKEYSKFNEDKPSDMPSIWTIERIVDITYESPKVVSFSFYETSFLGGAHPNTNIFYTPFNLLTGVQLYKNDVFIEGYEAKLTAIAEKKFREEKELTPDANLEEADFNFKDNKFALNSNFGFTKEGIIFYFNSYEIAPYALGPTAIELKYGEIKELLKKEFLPEGL